MNWFKYRLPGECEIFSGASHSLLKGFGKGFVIAPFRNPDKNIITIPRDFIPANDDIFPADTFVPTTTPKSDFLNEVVNIIDALENNNGKVVVSRVIQAPFGIDLNSTFDSLCKAYSDAFVFMFSTESTGTWIGASPELLLDLKDDKIFTMALAGTKAINDDSPWDLKNKEEQAMVSTFIYDTLSLHCYSIRCESICEKKSGMVKHLCTPISAELNISDDNSISSCVKNILFDLSPTPALCGSDRSLSFHLIEKLENFNRELYGGFCGPNGIGGSTTFYVNLRSAKCSPSATAVFVGAGITPLSDPEDEWIETEIKSKTIITKLQKNEN